MSKLIVEVCEVGAVHPMENSDFLERIVLKGWNVVVQKALNLKVGDPVVFFPPDSVLTEELADRLGIRKYLSPVKNDGVITGYRVFAAKLRGVSSFGTIDHQVPEGFKVGDDVSGYYGVQKWEPPITSQADQERDHPLFHRYTDIENVRNYPGLISPGEEVCITEKAHGSSGKIGLIKDELWTFMAGSHNTRRKVFDAEGEYSTYAKPLRDPNIIRMLEDLAGRKEETSHNVIVFYELIGSGVQDMAYGHLNGAKSYRAFDLSIDGNYVNADVKAELFSYYNIPVVPTLYQGSFSWEVVEAHTDGPTTLCEASKAGKFKGREGIVITPLKERTDLIGRVILKSISADYLSRKNGTDSH